jgi:hypothetical protein
MKCSRLRLSAIVFVVGLITALVSGCVVTSGYGYDGGVGIGLDYYEPYGSYYGGWGPGYFVGPSHDGGHRSDRGGGSPPHAYRPAPPSHAMPSIPSHSRSGRSRSR